MSKKELGEISKSEEGVINESKTNNKITKKFHNTKVMLTVLLGAIIVCVIFMIVTDAWNPFKSNSIEKEAQQKKSQIYLNAF